MRYGEDIGEKLDIVPAQFRVLVVRRPKYACRACEEVMVQAPAPARLIEGGIPTEATVAQILAPRCWSPNTLIICRSTGRLKSTSDRDRSRPLDARRLAPAPGSPKAARASEGLGQALRRRDDAPVLGPGWGNDEDRAALGIRSRGQAMAGCRSARYRLCLCARSQERTADDASQWLRRHPAGGRTPGRLSSARRRQQRVACVLSEPCAPARCELSRALSA